jgi:hypothetical protein
LVGSGEAQLRGYIDTTGTQCGEESISNLHLQDVKAFNKIAIEEALQEACIYLAALAEDRGPVPHPRDTEWSRKEKALRGKAASRTGHRCIAHS